MLRSSSSNAFFCEIVMKRILLVIALLATPGLLISPPAFGVSKEIIQLQVQVEQLQNSLQHMQSSTDMRLGALTNLIQQSTDNINKMTVQMNNLATEFKKQNAASSNLDNQLSSQIQSMNDTMDAVKTRLDDMKSQLQSIRSQMQNVNAAPPATGQTDDQSGGAQNAQPPLPPGTIPTPQAGGGGGQPQPQASASQLAPSATSSQLAPPADQLYQSAMRDYNAARYNIASSEFGDLIKFYPQAALAGNSEFYLGEIAYRQRHYDAAIKHYDAVLEHFSGNSKAPAAQLRKGQALLKLGKKEAAVQELRSLVQRYPQTPEAREGRSQLNGMGVRIYPKPSAYR